MKWSINDAERTGSYLHRTEEKKIVPSGCRQKCLREGGEAEPLKGSVTFCLLLMWELHWRCFRQPKHLPRPPRNYQKRFRMCEEWPTYRLYIAVGSKTLLLLASTEAARFPVNSSDSLLFADVTRLCSGIKPKAVFYWIHHDCGKKKISL